MLPHLQLSTSVTLGWAQDVYCKGSQIKGSHGSDLRPARWVLRIFHTLDKPGGPVVILTDECHIPLVHNQFQLIDGGPGAGLTGNFSNIMHHPGLYCMNFLWMQIKDFHTSKSTVFVKGFSEGPVEHHLDHTTGSFCKLLGNHFPEHCTRVVSAVTSPVRT